MDFLKALCNLEQCYKLHGNNSFMDIESQSNWKICLPGLRGIFHCFFIVYFKYGHREVFRRIGFLFSHTFNTLLSELEQ